MTNSYSSPWITRQLAYLKNKKTRLFKRFKISGWQTDFTKYSSAKAEFVQYNFDCYNNDLSRCKRDFKSNPKLFFLSSILNGNLNNNVASDDNDISNLFADFFQLTYTKCNSVINKNKEERYSRVPRLSDTRYSAKGTKGKWRYASSKARLKYATYRR